MSLTILSSKFEIMTFTEEIGTLLSKICDTNFYLIVLLPSLLSFTVIWWLSRPNREFPSGPIGLPILGYLPFLGKEPYRTLHNLKKKYGNVFSLYFGRTLVVILGDWSAVKDAFSKSSTLDRPEKLFDFIPDGVGFSSVNGEEWQEQRRYSVRSMRNLGLGKSRWVSLIEEEVVDFVKLIESCDGKAIDICKLLTSSVSNNIGSLVFGKRLPVGDPARDFLDHSVDAVSQFFSQSSFSNYFPWLSNIMVKLRLANYEKFYNDMQAFNGYIKNEVELHKKSLTSGNTDDFIDGYLLEMEDQRKKQMQTTFNEKNLRGNVQALFVGGSDTTRTSLNWLFLAMASFPEVQMKVHNEIDRVIGREKVPCWDDRNKLPYTYAVLMEGQRWKTIAPLNTSRIAQEDITICGHDIPKGTTIIANNWGLHNDTDYWKEPEKFVPDRFLTNGGTEVIMKPESYVAFSYGKRNCPGETVAMMEMLLYFSALMQRFEIRAPDGGKPDLNGILGLTYQAVPQKLCFISRS